ncbi:Hypothetical predicted protein [Mytilus galloprovincialis]|uniref:Uncharacterized protein n=1 Tax=Mytilus galloprovincialis TaxID=29158 RepID=A0A8B6GRH1_MYTGA|nr:Hypothetical predicted protein [Mytilus galloprovincialis]
MQHIKRLGYEANPVTNGIHSPCTATAKPIADESVCLEDEDRHHSNLQNNQQTCPVADDSQGTDRKAECLGPNSLAYSQSQTKRFSSACSIQSAPKKKNTAKDVHSLQCAVLEKELEKNILQIDLIKK